MLQALIYRPIRLGLALIVAIAALILTCVFDARPNSGSVVGSTVRVESSAAGPWCGPGDALGGRSCSYPTFEDCLLAADRDFRTCRPNPAALTIPDDAAYRTYHSVFLSGA